MNCPTAQKSQLPPSTVGRDEGQLCSEFMSHKRIMYRRVALSLSQSLTCGPKLVLSRQQSHALKSEFVVPVSLRARLHYLASRRLDTRA
ncbi:unnamed protein product, partial [Trichogramma brassicae]